MSNTVGKRSLLGENGLIRKNYLSIISMFTLNFFLASTISCVTEAPAPEPTVRPETMVDTTPGVSPQAQKLGVDHYRIEYNQEHIKAEAITNEGVVLGSMQVTMDGPTTHVISEQLGVTHQATYELQGLAEGKGFSGVYDGVPFSFAVDAAGNQIVTGTLPPPPTDLVLGLMSALAESSSNPAAYSWGCWACAGVVCALLALAAAMIAFPAAAAAFTAWVVAGANASGLTALLTTLGAWLGPGAIAALDLALKGAALASIVYCLSCVGITVHFPTPDKPTGEMGIGDQLDGVIGNPYEEGASGLDAGFEITEPFFTECPGDGGCGCET